jgi:hypothetical protein
MKFISGCLQDLPTERPLGTEPFWGRYECSNAIHPDSRWRRKQSDLDESYENYSLRTYPKSFLNRKAVFEFGLCL